VAITRPSGKAVALTMSTDPQEILRMALAVQPDYVHISTEPDEVPVSAMQWLRQHLPANIHLMKAIPVGDESSITVAAQFASTCDCLLLDTKEHGFPGVGATGKTHDWSVSRRIVEQVNIPVILAGGLTPENVAAAISVVHPWGVDSNTATNLPGDPLNKDMARVAAFVREASCKDRAAGIDVK
jgi:phosphoribosylanthranilate isomerase